MSCKSCNLKAGWTQSLYECKKPGCGERFCSNCLNYALSNDQTDNHIKSFCKSCFIRLSSLDYTKSVEVIGLERGEGPSIVFVHGAGGCRTMFSIHARKLSSKYRCILMDLPGHGSLMDTPLSLESAINTILSVTKEYASDYNGKKPIYVGASLGGYIGMELLGSHPDVFSKAAILMAGQDVGTGRGMTASLGLFVMGSLFPSLSAEAMLKGMNSQAKGNGHISDAVLKEMVLSHGYFFNQVGKHIEILKHSNPRASLPKYEGPILFINGSKDHRDSEKVWLESSKHGKLIVYEGTDHFFSHDDRYLDKLIQDLDEFLKNP
ncbi:hypothetical protein HDV02_006434 [Globomyces sp. JEL0801]|nr:hypothetical protein HDV02_006434 [Globomyces sp. JEL0801]